MITGIIKKLFGLAGSKDNAKSRLHFVLVQDRTGLTNEEMTGFKRELLTVIEKFFQINKDAFDVGYKRQGDRTTLFINSPVVVRRANPTSGKRGKGSDRVKEDPSKESKTDPVPQPV